MKNKTFVRFLNSLILLPALTMSGAPIVNMGTVSQAVVNIVNNSPIVYSQKQNTEALVLAQKLEDEKSKADAIDVYFKARNMPLEGMGMKMVLEAEKNELDWRLLPAIAVRESTGGKFACKKATFNFFGWGSCKIGFDSNEKAIETVARNLGGNNPKTEHHYAGKTTKEILKKYNPPSIVRHYAEQVISIMDDIGPEDTTPITNVTA